MTTYHVTLVLASVLSGTLDREGLQNIAEKSHHLNQESRGEGGSLVMIHCSCAGTFVFDASVTDANLTLVDSTTPDFM